MGQNVIVKRKDNEKNNGESLITNTNKITLSEVFLFVSFTLCFLVFPLDTYLVIYFFIFSSLKVEVYSTLLG